MELAFVAVIVTLFVLRGFEILYNRYTYHRLERRIEKILNDP